MPDSAREVNLGDMPTPHEKGLEYGNRPLGRIQKAREPSPMRNPYDLLRTKEQELMRVKKEIEALRITARLLGAEEPASSILLAKGDSRQVVEMP